MAVTKLEVAIETIVRSRFPSGEPREVDYVKRLAPYNIARVRVERLGRDVARVHWVFVPPAFRGLGLGGELLADVLRDCDRERLTVTLVAKACGTMPQRPLERWYEAFGFRGRDREADGGLEMSRRPFPRPVSRRLRKAA
jgi:GNAT superfamily N-acetyltransferase